MFEDLHDPDPPRPGLDTLAAVSERARRARRRRSLLVGGAAMVAVVALVAGVALFVGQDDERLAGVPTDEAGPASTTTDTVTTTPSTTSPVTEPAPTSAPMSPGTVSPPTSAPEVTGPPAAPPVPAADRPVVAVDGAGDAVYLPVGATEPVLLHDGTDPDDPPPIEGETVRVDGVVVLPDESAAFVGICCEPVAGSLLRTVPPAVATFDSAVSFGTAPALDPSGTRVAVVAYYSIVVVDGEGAVLAASDEMDVASTPIEVGWLDDTQLVVLSLGADGARLHLFRIEGDQLVEERQTLIADVIGEGVGGEGTFPRLAGFDASIFVVGIERDALVAFDRVTLERSEGSLGLPGPALTAWFDGEELVWVDQYRVLRVGDVVIPGEYVWARR